MTMEWLLYKAGWVPGCVACCKIGQLHDEIIVLNNPSGFGKLGAYIHEKCIDTQEGKNYSERLKEVGWPR